MAHSNVRVYVLLSSPRCIEPRTGNQKSGGDRASRGRNPDRSWRSGRFQTNVPAGLTIGSLLLAGLIAVALFCVVQICFYRALSIDALSESNYTVVPIVSIALRAIGEVNRNPWGRSRNRRLLRHPARRLVRAATMSFAAVLFFYFLAEISVVTVDIARHLQRQPASAAFEPSPPHLTASRPL